MLVVLIAVSGLASVIMLNGQTAAPPDISYNEDRTARVWVDLASVSAGTVRPEDRWGSVETFAGAPIGTNNYYRAISLFQKYQLDSVVLDGYVWAMISGNTDNAVFLRYAPEVKGPSWNISFEVYAPQGTNYFDPALGTQQIGLTATLVNASGAALASVDLSYGSPGCSWVRVRDIAQGTSYELDDRLLPSSVYRSSSEGSVPQRYIISFQHAGDGGCNVTVYHTSGVVVGQVSVAIPSGWGGPVQLVLGTSSHVLTVAGADQSVKPGSWALDNFACRGGTARYPIAGPQYEYAGSGSTVPGMDTRIASEQPGASVTIDGKDAAYNATTGRYETDLPLVARWGRSVNYTVELDGVRVEDRMSVTMYSITEHASVAAWWNGWDWVSVFGEDDCIGPATALRTYSDYNHPVTAYVMEADGGSFQILTTQSEIGLHSPHLWQTTGRMSWKGAVDMASDGMSFLTDNYDYASRWDSPSNGGNGDTYISMANPGNRASYQLMYALYCAGIRIDGRSTDGSGAPGNHDHIGSWYSPGSETGGWYPYNPIDLMDANRGLSWDNPRSWSSLFQQIDAVAQNGGVVRVYGHSADGPIDIPEFLHWIDDPKANYSLENWKATDGEVASYIFGRWSTSVLYNPDASDAGRWTFNVSRADPKVAGYWDVPSTVRIDLGGRTVKDIIVHDGDKVYHAGSWTLRDLNGARIMDMGYDIRDGVLYVSERWSSSATITVIFEEGTSAALAIDLGPVEMAMKDP